MIETESTLAQAIVERDRILIDFDVATAKAWIVAHGGKAPERVNWPMVLHLARLECTQIETNHNDLWWESRIWLARNGAVQIMTHPNKRECRVAMDLLFPKTETDAYIANMEQAVKAPDVGEEATDAQNR